MPASRTTDDEKLIKLKDQGRSFLKANQIDKALRIFLKIINEYPEDVASILILGDAFLSAGNHENALVYYQRANELQPGRRDIIRRIAVLQPEKDVFMSGIAALPDSPGAIAELIQRLTGRSAPFEEEEVIRASKLLDTILKSSSPASSVAEHLEEVDVLLPALIEVNIRQAVAEGRVDLVTSLQDLLAGILLQVDSQPNDFLKSGVKPEKRSHSGEIWVALDGIESNETPYRLDVMCQGLRDLGYKIAFGNDEIKEKSWKDYDVMVAHNPQGSPELMRGIAARSAANLPVIIDISLDYENLPTGHADYDQLGLNSSERSRSYSACLQLADLICVNNPVLAENLRTKGYPVEVIFEGWSKINSLWLKPSPNRSTFNIGINSSPGQIEDAALIRRSVIRILREYPHTRLVVAGDLDVYRLFDSVPDNRRMALPVPDFEEYPYLLAQLDLLLVPLQDNPFNRTRSDRSLMEAGIRRIPWVASPTQAHLAWGSGGLISYTTDEWFVNIQSLIQDEDLRSRLANAGHQKSMQRELNTWGTQLSRVIQNISMLHSG